jgi:hypothetical protein
MYVFVYWCLSKEWDTTPYSFLSFGLPISPPQWRLDPIPAYGFLTVEVSLSYLYTPPLVGCLRSSDQPDAETCTRQHTTFTRDIHATGGIRTCNSSKRAAADSYLGPRGHGLPIFIVFVSHCLSVFPAFGPLSCKVSLISTADWELRFPYCGRLGREIKWTGSQSDAASSFSYRTCFQSSTIHFARNARAAKFLKEHCFVTSAGGAKCNPSAHIKYVCVRARACVFFFLEEVGYETFVPSARHLKLHPVSDKNSIHNGSTVFTHHNFIPQRN